MDIRAVEKDWRRRGYTFGIWTDPAGKTWEDFVHDKDELFLLLEGEIELQIGGRVLQPAPGEEIPIPAGTAHSVRNRGATAARWAYGYRAGA